MRVVIATLLVATVLSLRVAPADCQVQVNGYFEPQLAVTVLGDDALQLNSNKVRIDLGSRISDDIAFSGNFNYTNYNGHLTWDLLDFVPADLAESVPDEESGSYSLRYEDQGKLDNAYLRFHTDDVMLTAGKQQVSVGSGYAWNPTDLFNKKDLLDPTYEQPGVNGLRVDVGLSDVHTLVAFYSPEDRWAESGKLLRFLGRVSHFDYAVSAGQWRQVSTDFAAFRTCEPRQDMLGFDFNGEILGVGCWSENAYCYIDGNGHYWESVTGVDYTFSSGWYVMAEYYHSDTGKKQHDDYSFNDWMRYLNAETKTLARAQLYCYTFYPLTDLLTVGGSIVHCTSDKSLLVIPTCAYSVSGNVTLTFFGSSYSGKEGTMYSGDAGRGAVLRLRAHF